MQNLRIYGEKPFKIAVLHGGPGAPGYMAPVARELSSTWGVLEPLQTAITVEGQVQELRKVLQNYADLPVCVIGSSWGAWLGFIVSAHFPEYIYNTGSCWIYTHIFNNNIRIFYKQCCSNQKCR